MMPGASIQSYVDTSLAAGVPAATAVQTQPAAAEVHEWKEYLLPKDRPTFLHFIKSAHAGSVFALYHAESVLLIAMLFTMLSLGLNDWSAPATWLGAGAVVVSSLCLAWAGFRQRRTTYESGVYTYQRVLSGRSYVRGNERIGPYEMVVDLHTGLMSLKRRFFEQLAIERAHSKSMGEAAQRTYEALLREDLPLVAEAMLGGNVLKDSDIVRCRLYMHPRYVPWVKDYQVYRYELFENGSHNHHWIARALASLIQLSAAGLRISQLRRNLLFKPRKLFKVFPTRTYLIMPEERESFIRKCVQHGDLSADYLTRFPSLRQQPATTAAEA